MLKKLIGIIRSILNPEHDNYLTMQFSPNPHDPGYRYDILNETEDAYEIQGPIDYRFPPSTSWIPKTHPRITEVHKHKITS